MGKDFLKKAKLQDFDGHTEFKKMSAEQKLQWLSSMARFLWLVRKSHKTP